MLIFQRKFWKSGLGSELFSITILLLGMAVLAGIVIWFSTYDAAIQSQIIADTVVDGAVSFAQNDMNIAEKPFEIAARRIFDANRTLTGETGRILIDHLTWRIEAAGEHPEYFRSAEWNYIRQRASTSNGSGRLSTYHFNFTRSVPNYTVRYAGPRYMDQLVTVTVDSSANIPFSSMFRQTSRAVSMTLARNPYNGRADRNASTGLNEYMKELEAIAYSEILLSEENREFSSDNVPAHGSLIQKVLLEARRYLGDGYARDGRIRSEPFFWPDLNRDGSETHLRPYSGGSNSYKDCYQFVNACFKVNEMSGIVEAQARYQTEIINRSITYRRLISAADIWREMHEDGAYTLSLEADSSKLTGRFKVLGRPWYLTETHFFFLTAAGNTHSCERDSREIEWLNASKTRVRIRRKVMTLEEAQAIYGDEESPIPCYGISSAESWDLSTLRVGDVLVFSDPNWNKTIYQELEKIYNASSPDDPVLEELDRAAGNAYICHYAIYIGNGRSIDCGYVNRENPDASENGVRIRDLNAVRWNGDPENTLLLSRIIRFGEPYGSADEIQTKISSGDIEDSWMEYN